MGKSPGCLGGCKTYLVPSQNAFVMEYVTKKKNQVKYGPKNSVLNWGPPPEGRSKSTIQLQRPWGLIFR